MARIVKRTHLEPFKLSIGGETKEICACGLSKNQPLCDGSHILTAGEKKDKLYWYDSSGKRQECPDAYPGIRTS